jgi:hypothetical protein
MNSAEIPHIDELIVQKQDRLSDKELFFLTALLSKTIHHRICPTGNATTPPRRI